MKLRHIFTLSLILTIPSLSCGPNMDSIDLSGCMRTCNVTAKQCLDERDQELARCALDDTLCQHKAVKNTELCLTTCLDCIAACVKVLEDQLKD